jgi:hypothetical protein
MGEEGYASDLRRVEQEKFSVTCCGVAKTRISRELRGGSGDSFAEGHWAARWAIGLAILEQEGVAVGIGDGQGLSIFYCSHTLFMEMTGGLAEVICSKGESSLGAEGSGHHLYFLTGFAGHVHKHLVVGDGLEVELIDVEIACGDGIPHGERDGDQSCRDAVGAEVLALVVGVERTRHVLGVLDVLRTRWLQRTGHREEQVARAGLSDRSGGEAAADVIVVDSVEIDAFKT